MESAQSIPSLPLFFSMFFFIYLIGYFLVFRNWSPKIRPEASSCLISILHGTPAVFLATHAILSDPNRGFASSNTKTQALVIDYSIAYFLMDLLHFTVLYPHDVIFIGHHLATLFVFLTCRHLVFHAAYAILSLLVLAVVTSASQNAWTLASARRHDNQFTAKVYDFLSPYFYAFYMVVRGFLGPFFVYQMGAFYASGGADTVIPKWVWISWLVVILMVISVNFLWVSNLCLQLYREREGKQQKKIFDEIFFSCYYNN